MKYPRIGVMFDECMIADAYTIGVCGALDAIVKGDEEEMRK